MWLALATIAVLGAAGAFVWRARSAQPSTTPETTPAPAPSKKIARRRARAAVAAGAQPAPVPAVAAPNDVRIEVKVDPADAQLLLDDAPIANPFDGHFARSDAQHKLEARAPGHKTEAQWIAFDHDRRIDLQLGRAPKPAAPATAARTGPSPPSSDDGKPIYKGTKGKLITDYPTE